MFPPGLFWERGIHCVRVVLTEGECRVTVWGFGDIWATVFEVRSTEGKWPTRPLVRWLPVCRGLEPVDVAGVRGYDRAVTSSLGGLSYNQSRVETFWCWSRSLRLKMKNDCKRDAWLIVFVFELLAVSHLSIRVHLSYIKVDAFSIALNWKIQSRIYLSTLW